jgi:SAM-dependent methyltransferase
MNKLRLSSHEMWERGYAQRFDSGAAPYAEPDVRCGTYEVVRAIRAHLSSGDGQCLVEMGCGGSKYLPWFAHEMGFAVEGIDYSESGCIAARRALDAVDQPGRIYCVDFMELDASFAARYDVVTSFGVVEHFMESAALLRRFATVLKPGGHMITFVPNLKSLAGYLIKRLNRELYDTHKLFALDEFSGYHTEAGLDVLTATYTEWLDFDLLPLDRAPAAVALLTKNLIHYANRAKLSAYKRLPSLHPQTAFACSGMIVIARKPMEPSAD